MLLLLLLSCCCCCSPGHHCSCCCCSCCHCCHYCHSSQPCCCLWSHPRCFSYCWPWCWWCCCRLHPSAPTLAFGRAHLFILPGRAWVCQLGPALVEWSNPSWAWFGSNSMGSSLRSSIGSLLSGMGRDLSLGGCHSANDKEYESKEHDPPAGQGFFTQLVNTNNCCTMFNSFTILGNISGDGYLINPAHQAPFQIQWCSPFQRYQQYFQCSSQWGTSWPPIVSTFPLVPISYTTKACTSPPWFSLWLPIISTFPPVPISDTVHSPVRQRHRSASSTTSHVHCPEKHGHSTDCSPSTGLPKKLLKCQWHKGEAPTGRPRAWDYELKVSSLILKAIHKFEAHVIMQDPVPLPDKQTMWVTECWTNACANLEEKYEVPDCIIRLVSH